MEVSDDDVLLARRLIENTPTVTANRICKRLEREHMLPAGSIKGRLQREEIVQARYDAIAELYCTFAQRGQRLSIMTMSAIFNRTSSVIGRALHKRGVQYSMDEEGDEQ